VFRGRSQWGNNERTRLLANRKKYFEVLLRVGVGSEGEVKEGCGEGAKSGLAFSLRISRDASRRWHGISGGVPKPPVESVTMLKVRAEIGSAEWLAAMKQHCSRGLDGVFGWIAA